MVHVVAAAVETVRAALDSCRDAAMYGLGDGEVLDLLGDLGEVFNRAEGHLLVPLVAEVSGRQLHKDLGAATAKQLVVDKLQCHPARAGMLVKVADATINHSGFEDTGRAIATGEISAEHANEVINAVRKLPESECGTAEKTHAQHTMLDIARENTPAIVHASAPSLFGIVCPHAAEKHRARREERERRRAAESRWLTYHGAGFTGSTELRVRLETVQMDRLRALLEPLTVPLPPEATGTDTPDTRCRERRGGDAFAELVEAITTGHYADHDIGAHDHDCGNDGHDDGHRGHGGDCGDGDAGEGEDIAGPNGHSDHSDPGQGAGDADDDMFGFCHDDLDEQPGDEEPGEDGMSGSEGDPDTGQDADGRQNTDAGPDAEVDPVEAAWQAEEARRIRAERRRIALNPKRATFLVRLDYDTITDQLQHGMLDTGHPVDAVTLARWACQADLVPVWCTDGIIPVAVANTHRYFDGKQRQAMITRDGGCIFTGCDRPPRYCHGHHIKAFRLSGKTTVADGVLLCKFHHDLIHHGGWGIRINPVDGVPETIPPPWLDPEQKPRRHIRHQHRL